MRSVRFELLRPAEIIAERDRFPVVYLPLGPLEWHAGHMPMGTDPLNAQAVTREVAARIGGVVLPTLFWGTERRRPAEMLRNLGFAEDARITGMDFPGNTLKSLYAGQEVFATLLRAMLDQVIPLGYRVIVLVNGHGARNHLEVLEQVSREYSAGTPATVLLTFALPRNSLGVAGHADAVETSLMLANYCDCVDLEILPGTDERLYLNTGIVDAASFKGAPQADFSLPPEADPRQSASAELGVQLFEAAVAEVIARVSEAIEIE